MKQKTNKIVKLIFIPLAAGICLLFVPLLGDFHIESAILASLIGCFWAGLRACRKHQCKSDFFSALHVAGYLYLAALPLLLHALWSGCFSIDGLGYWLIFSLPSIYFGYATGRLMRIWGIPYLRFFTVIVLLIIALGVFGYEFFTYPQLYFFNHVWGGWPGPIYDETVHLGTSAIFFRAMTVLWSLLLWYIPAIRSNKYAAWISSLAALLLIICYTQLSEEGIISPRSYIQNVLGGHKQTKHFDLYYDSDFYTKYDINLLAEEHEFYYHQIAQRLKLSSGDSTDRIESYLYANPWQKKKIVGAKFTSYVPVWLQQDQLHIAKQQINASLKHELVHVLTKRLANNWLHASWSIGLTEGVAVAVSGGSSPKSTIDQIVASEKPYPDARQMHQKLSPLGFYGGRSGVNYITTGSFVKFLLNNYQVSLFNKCYAGKGIVEEYPGGWKKLTAKWHNHLDSVKIDSIDKKTANEIFAIPSLFEQKCPHVASDFAENWDHYRHHMANHDTTKALKSLDDALTASDSLPPVKAKWAFEQLKAGHFALVENAVSPKDTTVDLQLLNADAYALDRKWKQAKTHVKKGQHLFDTTKHARRRRLKPALKTREQQQQWKIYLRMSYQGILPDSATFARAYYRTKIRSLKQAIQKERWHEVDLYAIQLYGFDLQPQYFDSYQKLIHYLIFEKKFVLANQLINKLSKISLRERYKQRLQQERAWKTFIKSKRR